MTHSVTFRQYTKTPKTSYKNSYMSWFGVFSTICKIFHYSPTLWCTRMTPVLPHLHERCHGKVVYVAEIPYRTKFRRKKFSAEKIFRHTKFSEPSRNFSIAFLFPHTIHKKNMFQHEICINLTCF